MDDNMNNLHEKMLKLQWLMQRHHFQKYVQRGPLADPTRGQGRILAMLKLKESISSKELSYLLGIRQQSLNELLNKLEKKGYVERIQSEEDRRVILVKLTELGRTESQESEYDLSSMYSCLSDEEKVTLGNYIDRMTGVLADQFDDDMNERFEKMMNVHSKLANEKMEHFMHMRDKLDLSGCLDRVIQNKGLRDQSRKR
ncbi:MarR family winged helix-turn-helix transcriptional regulator [Clostridium aminobutyricum]|uniref:MarR family transcriptional regulator n=1 Tax=Clostridium aminobutyricum TaxID=33953 RepID=A0A939D8R2_CLOAM|nr:MarR family transcriptional regulator [Clostridium aminobutyricum]MBN7773544.1 MarR family transcriptional regulator [Clostridium aminobutyricum]